MGRSRCTSGGQGRGRALAKWRGEVRVERGREDVRDFRSRCGFSH